jgi:hypothetical protein
VTQPREPGTPPPALFDVLDTRDLRDVLAGGVGPPATDTVGSAGGNTR